MDPVTMIVTALMAGVVTEDGTSVLPVARDAYAELKALVMVRLNGVPDIEPVLAGHESSPDAWRERLAAELDKAGAGHDLALVMAAAAFLRLTAGVGWPAEGHVVGAQGVQGLQVGDHNTQLNVYCYKPAAAGPAVRLPPRPAFLTGRDDLLAELHARLSAGNRMNPQIVALCGLGGCGKSSIAVEYAYRRLAGAGMVWQVPAEDPTAMAAGFGDLAAQLGVRRLVDAGDPVAQVHAALASHHEEWLLIFDNAPSPAAVRDVLPPAGHGQVLITSQDLNWPAGWALEVPVLEREVAGSFLQARTGCADLEAACDLAGELGGLPLALEQAAAFIRTSGTSIAGYRELFQERSLELLSRGQLAWYDKQVVTCWTLAFERVRAVPHAVGLLRLIAFLAPDRIPITLLLSQGSSRRAIPPEVRADLLPLLSDPLAVADAVSVLRRYSLITSPSDGAASVHRLVQAVTRSELSAELAGAWRRAAGSLLETRLTGNPEDPENWPMYAALLPHAQAALRPDSRSTAKVARYLARIGNYAAARSQQELVLKTRQRALGADHVKTLAAWDQLAHLIGVSGDAPHARDLYAALVRQRERISGVSHPGTLAARGNLAYWTGKAGDPAAARDQLAELLPSLGQVLDHDHPRALAARANLARWTGEAGDPATAQEQLTALLPLIEKAFGSRHPRTLATASNLAIWTGEAGDPVTARNMLEDLLPHQQETWGPGHPHTLSTKARLAHWTGEAGDPAAARNQLMALLPLTEEVLGPDHPEAVAARTSIAGWAERL